ncbi:MAG: DcaP family trimeric outer membrane transporter [Planctomycetota bacterium]
MNLKYKLLMSNFGTLALILSFLLLSTLWADETDEAVQIQREIENWKKRYHEDLSKLKEKVQQLKDRQAAQRKALPQTFDRLLDKYLTKGTEPITWTNFLSPKNRIQFYGFMRLDVAYDSDRTDEGNKTFFVRNHNDPIRTEDEEFNITARQTRFGLNLNGTPLSILGNPELSGKLEIDFDAGGPENRNLPRMRHAYLELNWKEKDIKLLAGQTYDVVSPLNPDSIDYGNHWNAGNTGDRRPQLRVTYSPSLVKINDEDLRLNVAVALLRTGAIDGQDIDADGNNDGEDSGTPMMQWRVGLDIPALVEKSPIQIGFWGSHGWEESQTRIGTNTEKDFSSLLLGFDLKIPIHERFTFSTEMWWGHNLNDLRGGIAQGIDTFHGKEIEAFGGWFSGKVKITDMLSASAGYTFDNPQDEDVSDFPAATGRFRNQAYFINNVWELGSGFSTGYEYQYMLTAYSRKDQSNYNNRGMIFFMYKW